MGWSKMFWSRVQVYLDPEDASKVGQLNRWSRENSLRILKLGGYTAELIKLPEGYVGGWVLGRVMKERKNRPPETKVIVDCGIPGESGLVREVVQWPTFRKTVELDEYAVYLDKPYGYKDMWYYA